MARRPLLFILLALTAAAFAQIAIKPVEGFNLKIIDRPSATTLVVKPDPPQHQWFAGTFINLPVGQPVEIRVNMTGCDTLGNVADTAKWTGLRPVYTYADPEQYEAYEWFRRDRAGRWLSGDLFKTGDARQAGADATPKQTAIPADLADRFRAADGEFWYPWAEIDGGKNDKATRTFTFTITPAAPTMTIAMHVPYPPAYERALITRLQAAKFPGVFVDQLGKTAGGRPLYMIRVDDPLTPLPLQVTPVEAPVFYTDTWQGKKLQNTSEGPVVRLAPMAGSPAANRRVFFLDAREHPTEHTGSWVVLGALQALLADTPDARRLRNNTVWLLLPVYDPDGAAAGEYDTRTDACWMTGNNPRGAIPETMAYVTYLRAFANAGLTFAASATFYNLECTDGKPVCCPFSFYADKQTAIAFNTYWFRRLQAAGIPAGPTEPWGTGALPFRLATSCNSRYKALSFTFEVNDRFPECRLTLEGLELLGADYLGAVTDWFATPDGKTALEAVRAAQRKRLLDIEERAFIEHSNLLLGKPSHFELFVEGY